jgi:DNA-binding transcriptional ArsR family regulator
VWLSSGTGAVLEVLDEGATVTDVARRYGVARQTVHQWLRRYANEGGLGGLADLAEAGLAPAADARCGGGAGSGGAAGASGVGAVADPLAAGAEGVAPLPGRSGVYRALLRHGLVDGKKRKRPREDYRRWSAGGPAHPLLSRSRSGRAGLS